MTTAYTSLLGLALPVTGELSGTWGDTVNDSITSLLDSAVAGTTTISSDADVTLTTTTGASNTSRQAIILWTAGGAVTRNITAPAQSKIYTVINKSSSTQSIVLRGAGPTTGVTIVQGESAVCAWNGSDFIKISNTSGAGVFTTLSVSGAVTLSGGTANGVAYLNGSKVLTTGSGLVFDSSGNLGLGTGATTPGARLDLLSTTSGMVARFKSTGAYASVVADSTGTTGGGAFSARQNGTTLALFGVSGYIEGNTTTNAFVFAESGGSIKFYTNGSPAAKVTIDTGGAIVGATSLSLTAASGYPVYFNTGSTNVGRFSSNVNGIFTVGNQDSVGALGTDYATIGAWGSAGGGLRIYRGTGAGTSIATIYADSSSLSINADTSSPIIFNINGSEAMRIASATGGVGAVGIGYTSLTSVGNNGLAVLGNVGIGTSSPAYKLDVSKAAAGDVARFTNGGASNKSLFVYTDATYAAIATGVGASGNGIAFDAVNNKVLFTTASTNQMFLDASGNLGLGVTPSTWGTNWKTYEIGSSALSSINGFITFTSDMVVGSNAYYDGAWKYKGSFYATRYAQTTGQHQWYTAPSGTAGNAITFTQAMTLDASGNLLVGTTTGSNHYIAKAVAEGSDILGVISTTTNLQTAYFMGVSSAGENAAASAIGVRKNSSTSRSINAAGTINASGADYAEYMTKAGNFTVAKGDVVGIDANGKLTNVFANAVSFVVKSTDPSYVGGDTWGSVDVLGQRPNEDATQEVKDAFNAALEAARQAVDRIAFAGQVPVNVTGATAGQYIIPVNDNGAIKGEAVSNPTFEQYQIAVGKVIAIESDGRAKIIVKVA